MTVERRLVFEPADIRALTLECKKCGVRLTAKAAALDVPRSCPGAGCSQGWWGSALVLSRDQGQWPYETLAKALADINAIKDNAEVGFRLLLEFDEPPRAS